jgi:hypothetical protein
MFDACVNQLTAYYNLSSAIFRIVIVADCFYKCVPSLRAAVKFFSRLIPFKKTRAAFIQAAAIDKITIWILRMTKCEFVNIV